MERASASLSAGFGLLLAAVSAAAVDIVHVPGEIGDLQTAIGVVPDGGIIEVAPGTYTSPSGGFWVSDAGKGFTIRAGSGGQVILDGLANYPVFRLANNNLALGRQITFDGIVFYRGRSVTDGVGGGVTVSRGEATFVRCSFIDNFADASITGGGGVFVWGGSVTFFIDCTWTNNVARNEGAGLRVGDSTAFLHRCVFTGNSANPPNHRAAAAGGGIHTTDSVLRVTNTRFATNEAGYVGGGLYALGSWPQPETDVVVSNCTFEGNSAVPDPSVIPPGATEGGAIHIEDNSALRLSFSRLLTNSAGNGGGLNLYRSDVQVDSSVFRGNRATDTADGEGYGGAISVISNDTVADGANNRRSGTLAVRDSLVQGRHGTVGTTGQQGGCLSAVGDGARHWGHGGVSPTAGAAETRANLALDGVVLHDCDVTAAGGAVRAALTNLDMAGSLVLLSDANGPSYPSSGGLRLILESLFTAADTTLARNNSGWIGGAILADGSDLTISSCRLIENGAPGISGSAMFITSYPALNLAAVGQIVDSVVSNSSSLGRLIFDSDYLSGPINDFRYNNNRIFDTSSGQLVYHHTWAGDYTVSGLNTLVVTRAGGVPSTEKSQHDNINPASAPVVGDIAAAPSIILPVTAAGDPATSTDAFLGYAWSGGNATLDGGTVTGNAGLVAAGAGSHTLSVGAQSFTATVTTGGAPALQLTASPSSITSGGSSTLSWSSSGSFIDFTIDQGVAVAPSPAGSVLVSPTCTTTYHAVLVAKEGGETASVTVYVDDPLLFADGFEDGTTEAWSAAQP